MKCRSIAMTQLLQQAIADRGTRVLREVESVAATIGATQTIREEYDPRGPRAASAIGWRLISAMIWSWSSTAPTMSNTGARAPPVISARSNCRTELTAVLDFSARASRCRARYRNLPPRRARSAQARPARCPDRAVREADPRSSRRWPSAPTTISPPAMRSAPVVLSVKYIDDDLLREIGDRLQLSGLHRIDEPAQAGDQHMDRHYRPAGRHPSHAWHGSRQSPAARSRQACSLSSPSRSPRSRCSAAW